MSVKRVFKLFFKSQIFRTIICWLASLYIRFVYLTSRITVTSHEEAQIYMRGEQPAIFAFWHARLLMIPPVCPPLRKMYVLISSHNDGEMIARTMHHFGFGTLRGSSSKGGRSLASNAVKMLQAGHNVAITPDGPRGPAMQVQLGAVMIPRMAHVPVIPVTYGASKHKKMRSWDRFMLALPFGTLHYKIGAPLQKPDKDTLEAIMIRITEDVDAG